MITFIECTRLEQFDWMHRAGFFKNGRADLTLWPTCATCGSPLTPTENLGTFRCPFDGNHGEAL